MWEQPANVQSGAKSIICVSLRFLLTLIWSRCSQQPTLLSLWLHTSVSLLPRCGFSTVLLTSWFTSDRNNAVLTQTPGPRTGWRCDLSTETPSVTATGQNQSRHPGGPSHKAASGKSLSLWTLTGGEVWRRMNSFHFLSWWTEFKHAPHMVWRLKIDLKSRQIS